MCTSLPLAVAIHDSNATGRRACRMRKPSSSAIFKHLEQKVRIEAWMFSDVPDVR